MCEGGETYTVNDRSFVSSRDGFKTDFVKHKSKRFHTTHFEEYAFENFCRRYRSCVQRFFCTQNGNLRVET